MKLAALFLLSMLSACGGGGSGGTAVPDAAPISLTTVAVASGLSAPMYLTAPAGDTRLFIVERAGRILIFQNGAVVPIAFLDISGRVNTAGEGGLLSMAFDPQFAVNGFFYVYFTDPTGDIAIERFRVSFADPNVANPAALRIITITHRTFDNHKGGLVAFGPDGFLYLATGDGGGGGDPLGNAQNLNSLLGKLLRIDVSNSTVATPYAIPPGNPFVGQPGRRGEIWASGLRNPWRYAFDPVTGLLYIGDVGQNRIEEVNMNPAAGAGLNYGWNVTEGSLCFPADPCNRTGITLPVLEYAHDASGGCSITGGFVYRGSAFPEIQGRYFYSDFCSGFLRSFVRSGGAASDPRQFIANMGQAVSFGEDGQKELYVLTTAGQVLRIVRVNP